MKSKFYIITNCMALTNNLEFSSIPLDEIPKDEDGESTDYQAGQERFTR